MSGLDDSKSSGPLVFLYGRDEPRKLASDKGVQLSSTLDKNTSLRLISWRSFQALSSIANTWETWSAITERTSTSFRKKLQRILMCRSGQARPFRLCLKENLQVAQNADQPAGRHAKLSRARSRSR